MLWVCTVNMGLYINSICVLIQCMYHMRSDYAAVHKALCVGDVTDGTED